jgi:hypothetical protein
MSTYIADEIRAYATIRDLALAEAEKLTNSLNLERARIANEFVENALKPARSLLKSHLDALARDHAHAA